MSDVLHLADDRLVVTWQHGGWPMGVITGYYDTETSFVLEHICVFPQAKPWMLRAMLRDALEAARLRCTHIKMAMPYAFPPRERLLQLAINHGFRKYDEGDGMDFWVRWL